MKWDGDRTGQTEEERGGGVGRLARPPPHPTPTVPPQYFPPGDGTERGSEVSPLVLPFSAGAHYQAGRRGVGREAGGREKTRTRPTSRGVVERRKPVLNADEVRAAEKKTERLWHLMFRLRGGGTGLVHWVLTLSCLLVGCMKAPFSRST